MPFTNLVKPAVGDPTKLQAFAWAIIDDLVYLYNQLIGSDSIDAVANSSFENDIDADGVPDQWVWTSQGGTVSLDSSSGNQKHGARAAKITNAGSGGGFLETSEYFAISNSRNLTYQFATKHSASTTGYKFSVRYFDYQKVFISEDTIINQTTGNPTSFAYRTMLTGTIPSTARFAKIRFYGAQTNTGSSWFDDLRIIPDALNKTPTAIVPIIASGTFVVPDSISRIVVRCWGGGGGGGKGDSASAGSVSSCGGGGGGGGHTYSSIAVTPGETLTVTIGSGGAGSTGSDGGNGVATSLKRGATTLVSANGGTGGTDASVSSSGSGGSGAGVGTGSITLTGQSGTSGVTGSASTFTPFTGAGGSSPSGGPGALMRVGSSGVGTAGILPGGGGGGGGQSQNGGAGGFGLMVIEY